MSFKLLAGLGNPGPEYAGTRHNLGFMLIDAMLSIASDEPFASVNKLSSSREKYELWKVSGASYTKSPLLLLKPLEYMNNSGIAVQKVSAYYNIAEEEIIIAHDEMDLPLGEMRFKIGGGSAGHNGIKSITQCMGTPNFYRLRLGIGKKGPSGSIRHVLGHFNKDDIPVLEKVISAAIDGLVIFQTHDFKSAQQHIHSFKLEE